MHTDYTNDPALDALTDLRLAELRATMKHTVTGRPCNICLNSTDLTMTGREIDRIDAGEDIRDVLSHIPLARIYDHSAEVCPECFHHWARQNNCCSCCTRD